MRYKSSVLLAVITALMLVTVVSAQALNFKVYLPIVRQGPTATARPTITVTPTITPTPQAGVTPTPSANDYNLQIEGVYATGDPKSEYVDVKNHESFAINIKDYVLEDAPDGDGNVNRFYFPSFTLNAGATVRVWSKSGNNTSTDLFWGINSNVWEEGKDYAKLFDFKGNMLDKAQWDVE